MNMGDVFAAFGLLLSLGLALPGMLVAWSLIFPNLVNRERLRLQQTPWACFGLGLLMAIATLLPCLILLKFPLGIAKLAGWSGIFILLTFVSVGTSGLTSLMGERLRSAGTPISPPSALLRGAIALELGAIFPIIGWFIFSPLVAICSLGALGFGLLNWLPPPEQVKVKHEVAYASHTS